MKKRSKLCRRPDYRKINKAYRGIERDCIMCDTDSKEFARADNALRALAGRTISKTEFDYYVSREEDMRMLSK